MVTSRGLAPLSDFTAFMTSLTTLGGSSYIKLSLI